jgi:hypothetical protein
MARGASLAGGGSARGRLDPVAKRAAPSECRGATTLGRAKSQIPTFADETIAHAKRTKREFKDSTISGGFPDLCVVRGHEFQRGVRFEETVWGLGSPRPKSGGAAARAVIEAILQAPGWLCP